MCDVDLRVCTGPGDVMKLMSLIYVHLNCICLVKWRVTRVILICLFAFRRSPVDLCHLLLKELVEAGNIGNILDQFWRWKTNRP